MNNRSVEAAPFFRRHDRFEDVADILALGIVAAIVMSVLHPAVSTAVALWMWIMAFAAVKFIARRALRRARRILLG